jgi:hypothetical protein
MKVISFDNLWGKLYSENEFQFQNLIDTAGCNVLAAKGTTTLINYGMIEDFKKALAKYLWIENGQDWAQVLLLQFSRMPRKSSNSKIKEVIEEISFALDAPVIFACDLPGGHGNKDTHLVLFNIQKFKDGVRDGSIPVT